jgi:tetratricopeptide (TPR) repeat protein
MYENCIYALRGFVFSTALQCFQDVLGSAANQHDPGILLQVGRCYKGAGNYELALEYMDQAIRFKRDDGETLAELADVYALLEETKIAKVMFREAFFVDPQSIDIMSMESEMIIRLRNKVRKLGYEGTALAEWIPIYGYLFGVFSVKRELKPKELGRLKQSIFTMENEIRANSEQSELLKPRLINHYFWLIDHYENTREDPALIEETMLKIRVIDPAIYEHYRN